MTVSDFPVSDEVLASLEHAMGGMYEVDDDGTHHLVGADYSVTQLLKFLSGINPEDGHWIERFEPGITFMGEECEGIWEQHQPEYSRDCVIRALIQEVRRLRMLVPEEARTL